MPANDWKAPSDAPQTRSLSAVLWLLFLGTLLALAGNIYQFEKGERMARDLALMQRNVHNQFAEIKELESGAFEQTLRRLDGLNKQFEGINATTLQQTRSEVRRSRSDLHKALEKKHKEVVRQMSELQSDLKRDASAQVSQVSNDLEKTRLELERAMNDISINSTESPVNSEEPATITPALVPQEPPVQAPKKAGFWSKLNPIKKNKRKTDSASK